MAAVALSKATPTHLGLFQRLAGLMVVGAAPVATAAKGLALSAHAGPVRAPLRLAQPQAAWLGAMADVHNFGSRNKTLRDLLCFYVRLSAHELERALAGVEGGRGVADGDSEPVLEVHITRQHTAWLSALGEKNGLGVNSVLARLVSYAQAYVDDDYVFEQNVCCPGSTVELYSDCDIYSSLS